MSEDNEFTRFDPTDAERETLKRIHGAYDDATALRQLREYPLPDGHKRWYTDQTGRFFEDVSPEQERKLAEDAKNDPIFQDLMSEINKEIGLQIMDDLRKAR